ncbi:Cytokinin hydroxylase [Linum perenne]
MAMLGATISVLIGVGLILAAKIVYETLTSYYLTPKRIKLFMEQQGIRGPKPRPLIGNIPDMSSLISQSTSVDCDHLHHDIVPRLLPHFVLWSQQYGKRFIYWNGTEPRLCLTEPELIKELMTKYSTKAGKSWMQQQGTKHFIGKGLLMANGENWYHQRHVISPAFMGEKLKSYAGHMVECTKKMIQTMEIEMKESEKCELEISEYMTRLTADIIARTEFDSNYEKGKQIFHLLTLLQPLCAQASKHLYFPGSRFVPSKYNREIKTLKTEVERLLMEIIQSRKDGAEIGRSSSYGNDLLGVLLNQLRDKPSKDGLQLIMDECKTFFFAGHETTALLLTWTVMLLASNPCWQHKVRAQVNQVCNSDPVSLEHLPKLNLVRQLNMVINESMRLYPPATVLPRMAFEDIKLGDLNIPKGLSIWIPVLAIHHSKELWGKDADEFNPDRFVSRTYAPGRHFFPFAAGPRNCIGQSFAMMEAKIILAMLVSKFSFTLSPSYRHAPVTVLTIKPKYGVQVCLKPLA